MNKIVIYPQTFLGALSPAEVAWGHLSPGVTEVRPTATVSSQPAASLEECQVEAVDLSALSESEQVQVWSLLQRCSTVFSAHESDLACTNLVSHDIPLLDDVPVQQRYQRILPSDYEAVKTHINQPLEAQVIRESSSLYASPIVLAWKKDGSLPMCVNYHLLKVKTRKDTCPLPHIKEVLHTLSWAQWFSTLDLASDYNEY